MIADYSNGCYKCGRDDISVSKFELLGSLDARLCISCANAWDDLVETKPEWIELSGEVVPLLGLLFAQTKADGKDRREEFLMLVRRKHKLLDFFRQLAKDWLASK